MGAYVLYVPYLIKSDLTTILFSLYVFVSVFEPTSVVLFPSAILSQHSAPEFSAWDNSTYLEL